MYIFGDFLYMMELARMGINPRAIFTKSAQSGLLIRRHVTQSV
jgi:hypothetical protein